MKIKKKLLFSGTSKKVSKSGNTYYTFSVYDLDSGTPLEIFINEVQFNNLQSLKIRNEYDFTFNLSQPRGRTSLSLEEV